MNNYMKKFTEINLKNINGVYFSDDEIVITGIPKEEETKECLKHNCDVMGCSSVGHVLFRAQLGHKKNGYDESYHYKPKGE